MKIKHIKPLGLEKIKHTRKISTRSLYTFWQILKFSVNSGYLYHFRCSFLDYHVFLNIHPSETILCQGHGHRRSPEKFKNKHIEALHFLPQKLSTFMCLIEPLAKNLMCLYKKRVYYYYCI